MPASRTKRDEAPPSVPAEAPASRPSLRRIGGALTIGAAAMLWAAYRLLTFHPQPIDSPQTLRPILYSFYSRFIGHYANVEAAHQAWREYSLLLLLLPPLLVVLNYLDRSAIVRLPSLGRRIVASRALLFASIAASLIALRFPALLAGELNPDESEVLAAAHKLFTDPVYFRSVDCQTTGPLNVFPLMLPAIFGISPDYASGRIIALLIILASIFFAYRIFSMLTRDSVARVAVIPMVAAFGLMKDANFLHYSSEHVSLLLTTLAVYAGVRVLCRAGSDGLNVAGLGMLLAAASFAKWQGVPGIACIIAITLAWMYWRGLARPFWRPYLLLVSGAAPLLVLNLIVCLAAGVWRDFWTDYVVMNFAYSADYAEIPAFGFAQFVLQTPEIHWLIVAMLTVLPAYLIYEFRPPSVTGLRLLALMGAASAAAPVMAESVLNSATHVVAFGAVLGSASFVAALLLLYQERKAGSREIYWFGFLIWASLLAAACETYVSHRPYAHYLLFLVIPLAMAMSWPIARAHPIRDSADSARRSAGARPIDAWPLVLVFMTSIVAWVAQTGAPDLMEWPLPARVGAAESGLIESLVRPGGRIAIWGWNAKPYSGAGRAPATRDLNMARFSRRDQRMNDYYRKRFVEDLTRHPADLFVDASENSLGGTFPGFELIPSIDSYIRSNYAYIGSGYKERFYLRRDLAPGFVIAEERPCRAEALRCLDRQTAAPVELPAIQLPAHVILEATFIPEGPQEPSATVFSNYAAGGGERRGFWFQAMGHQTYQLTVGVGSAWEASRPLMLPSAKAVSLTVEFNGNVATLRVNGTQVEQMRLSGPVADSPSPLAIGSSVKGEHPFSGAIRSFELRDLGAPR